MLRVFYYRPERAGKEVARGVSWREYNGSLRGEAAFGFAGVSCTL
jgi:hypothetical protein